MRRTVLLISFVAAAACAGAGRSVPPGPDTGRREVARRGAVTSANPLASEAGLALLRAGGNAIDAAVATAFAIGVVEPQMSGLGGGGAMTIWIQAERLADYLDFYPAQNAETYRAALAAGRIATGRPPPGDLRITGVPGNVAGLLAAHDKYGRMPLANVMAPAIRLAEEGFPINQILGEFILGDSAKLHRFAPSAALMWPAGRPLAPGDVLRNPELAAALRRVAEQGVAGFYEGETARAIINVLNANGNPTTLADLENYEPTWKRPLCADYRGRVLLSAPPPQTGSQVLHTLELLEPFDLASLGLPTRSGTAFNVLASALRVGMADRVNDDPNWRPVPAAGIASDMFARERASLVGAQPVPDTIQPGDAARFDATTPPPSCAPYDPYGATPAIPGVSSSGRDAGRDDGDHDAGGETTHISVVDDAGNAVALTQTNSTTFGSGANVSGFFLNDSGYIFSAATASAPSLSPWRTRTTTIAPTIVIEGGRVVVVVGAPGGGLIPTSIVQAMVYVLDYGMDPLEAVRMPRLFPTPNTPAVQLEVGFAAFVLEDAKRLGWAPTALPPGYARLYMIVRQGDHWVAVADPRHNGEARGW